MLNKIIFFFMLLCATAHWSFAATAGKIVGIVSDAQTSEPLPGANVYIEGTTLGSATGFMGDYRIWNVPPGSYTLIVRFIGFKEVRVPVRVNAGEELVQDIELAYEGLTGEEVTVIAQAKGQMAAINQQISDRTIKNIVSEARIRQLPDANAAESLGRLPGVSIQRSGGEAASVRVRGLAGGANTVTVEGMRIPGGDLGGNSRAVGLAGIPSQMIGGIELQKAFTPDHDADVTGGGITFKLKEAESGFQTDLFLRQGYNGFTKSAKMQDFSLTMSNRYFDDRFGILFNGSVDQKDRGTDFFTANYDVERTPQDANEVVPVRATSAQLRNRLELRKRLGLTVNMDYQLPGGKLTGQVFYSNLSRTVEQSTNSFNGDDRSIGYTAELYDQIDRSLLLGLAGNHTLFNGKLDWRLYHSESLADRPDAQEAFAALPGAISHTVDQTRGPENLLLNSVHDAEKAKLSLTRFRSLQNKANDQSAIIDYELPFAINDNISGYFKFGGKYRATSRKFTERGSILEYGIGSFVDGTSVVKRAFPEWNWQYNNSGALNYANFVRNFEPQSFGDGKLNFYYPVDFDKLNQVISATRDDYIRDLRREVNNYDNRETFSAAYFMLGLDLGPYITFTPGFRYEYNRNITDALKFEEYQGPGHGADQGAFTNVTAESINDFWLPMINLKIQATEWFDIRTAVTKTLTRPGFQSYSPRFYITQNKDVRMGNPALKPQTSQNYDLYLSVYNNTIGLFTAGGFYKKFEDQIFSYSVVMVDPGEFGFGNEFKNRELTQQINNKWSGDIRGVEFDWQTHFWYLPSPLNGIVLNVNYTHMNSTTTYPFFHFENIFLPEPPWVTTVSADSFRVNKITGMPDDILNVSLGYEREGFSGRVSMYYQGFTITNAENRIKSIDRNQDTVFRWDVQLSQKVFSGFQVYLNLNNLTDWPDRAYLTFFDDFRTRQENYGWTGDLGFRYNF